MDKQAKDFVQGWEEYKADKQKQIEEMAKVLCANNCRKDGYSCSLYSSDDDWVCLQERERAEVLYNAGYRKIPEGAVVLSPEERDEEMREIRQAVIERMEATRKETAEKFAERLKEDKDIKLILTNVRYMQTPINEAEKAIMKKFDEICKELEGENGT